MSEPESGCPLNIKLISIFFSCFAVFLKDDSTTFITKHTNATSREAIRCIDIQEYSQQELASKTDKIENWLSILLMRSVYNTVRKVICASPKSKRSFVRKKKLIGISLWPSDQSSPSSCRAVLKQPKSQITLGHQRSWLLIDKQRCHLRNRAPMVPAFPGCGFSTEAFRVVAGALSKAVGFCHMARNRHTFFAILKEK